MDHQGNLASAYLQDEYERTELMHLGAYLIREEADSLPVRASLSQPTPPLILGSQSTLDWMLAIRKWDVQSLSTLRNLPIGTIKGTMEELDDDVDGILSEAQFGTALQRMGLQGHPQELHKAVVQVSTNYDLLSCLD